MQVRLGIRLWCAGLSLAAVWACVPRGGLPEHVPQSIGGPCLSDKDCASSLCWVNFFNNDASKVTLAGGYCSRDCTTDLDCADANATCTPLGGASFCLRRCTAASNCRGTGYACLILNPSDACFSDVNLNCDPTAGDGSCTTFDGLSGGCQRSALGNGKTGECVEGCVPGPGECLDSGGSARQCTVLVFDFDDSGNATGDKWVGPLCVPTLTPPVAADGQDCFYAPDNRRYVNACRDGSECYLQSGMPAGRGFDSRGDNKCHQLCGDALSPACPSGQTCRDVFGLNGSPHVAGLCLQ